MGHKGKMSPHKHVIDRMELPARALAPTINQMTSHSSMVRETDVRNFFEYYKNDPILARTDAFVCNFPAAMCEMYRSWLV